MNLSFASPTIETPIWSDALTCHASPSTDIHFSDLLNYCKTIDPLGSEAVVRIENLPWGYQIGDLISDSSLMCGIIAESLFKVSSWKTDQATAIDQFRAFKAKLEDVLLESGGGVQALIVSRFIAQSFQSSWQFELLQEAFRRLIGTQNLNISELDIPENARNLLPKIYVSESESDAAKAAGIYAANFIRNFSHAYLVCATGNTMEAVYRAVEDQKVNCAGIFATHLDGYINLQSPFTHGFANYIEIEVLQRLGIVHKRVINESVVTEDEISQEVSSLVALHNQLSFSGSPGLCFLGIGPSSDPHIAFIPKGASWSDVAGSYALDPSITSRDSERGQPIQTHAISLGLTGILRVPQKMLVAYGGDKGASLAASLTPHLSSERVGTALMLSAARTAIFIDKAAADVLSAKLKESTW